MSRYKITNEDKAVFNRDGYWISPKLIDDEQIERLRQSHERIWSRDYDGDGFTMNQPWKEGGDPTKLRKLDNGWWVNDEVRKVVCDPYIGELAADLMETDEVRLWHDQVIYKPGTGGVVLETGNVGWHQDFAYWQASSKMNMVTVWIALQDTDLSNGGMSTILGSHQWGLNPSSNTFFDQNLNSLKEKYAAQGYDWVEEPCVLKAGQASFHHALTYHGSGPNLTDQPRLSIVAHLMPEGTAYRAGIQRHDNIRLLGPRPVDGQLFANEYFPVLFSR